MEDSERKIRAEYLYLSCCHAAVKFTNCTVGILEEAKVKIDANVREVILREVGMLFRFWATRATWEDLIENSNDAKWFNLYLFQLFNSGFKIPKEDTGMQYAKVSGTVEEVKEFGRRICNALKFECAITMLKINAGIPHWIKVVLEYTKDAVELPIEQIKSMIKEIKEK